jgi:NAD dependent epimerase/dehydratase
MSRPTMITGAGGFIGSHLVELLVRTQAGPIKAFTHYNSRNFWGWLEDSPVLNDIEVVTGDVRDFDSVRRCMDACDTVYHLAALIGIPYSYVSPHAYIDVNIGGTYNVLQAARDVGCQQVLVTSTSETYGTAQSQAISEDHPQVAQSPYAATKIGADQLALSFYRSFGLPVKIVRPFNTFGPRQSARAIIPSTIAQILSGERRVKAGNLSPTRDLTYVLDTVEGFVQIAQCDALVGQVTNIGRNDEVSVGDLVKLIATLMKREVEFDVVPERMRGDKSEVQRLRCDNQKLVDFTPWRPRHSLEQGLIETIEWFRSNAALYKGSVYNV